MKAWGRLTLQSNKPRMDANVSSSMLYYTPFENNDFAQLSLSLTGIIAGNLYDIYLNLSNNTLFLTDSWVNNSTPYIGRAQDGGLYFDEHYSSNLYLGTARAISDNTAAWQLRPNHAAYGTNNELGLFNAYNRLFVTAICRDSTSYWDYANAGLRFANNSNNNRINWVDGIGDAACCGRYQVSIAGVNSSAAAATVGAGLDQDSYPINWDGMLPQGAMNNNTTGMDIVGKNWTNGLIGRHSWQAIEQTTNVPITFFGNNFMCLTATLEV